MIFGRRIPSLGPRGEGWLALQLVLIISVAVTGWLLGGELSAAARGLRAQIAGGLLVVVGLVIAGLGIANLGRSLSALPRPSERAVLISQGIYSRIRHPIYAGLVCIALGWSMVTGSLVAFALSVVLAIVLDLKSRREEVWLLERFPDYAAYAARTKRFIPGIY